MKPVIIPATLKQTATIIFLHGLGDTGYGLSEIFLALRPAYAKLVCPTAPIQHVTLHDSKMPSWFDLRPLDQPKDEEGITRSRLEVEALVRNEVKSGIPESRIVLGGFSQGGALALYTGLFGDVNVAGVLALSTWLPLERVVDWTKVKITRVLQCQGDQDDLVSLSRAAKTAKQLAAYLPEYRFKVYPGLDHSLNSEEEIHDIREFFETVLPPIVPANSSSKL